MRTKTGIYKGKRICSSLSGAGKTGCKDILFHKWCSENWTPHVNEWNWATVLHCTQNQLKWIKQLNIRPEITKFLNEKGVSFQTSSPSNDFFGFDNKSKNNKQVGLPQTKRSFCTAMETTKWKGNLWNRRTYLQITYHMGVKWKIISSYNSIAKQ